MLIPSRQTASRSLQESASWTFWRSCRRRSHLHHYFAGPWIGKCSDWSHWSLPQNLTQSATLLLLSSEFWSLLIIWGWAHKVACCLRWGKTLCRRAHQAHRWAHRCHFATTLLSLHSSWAIHSAPWVLTPVPIHLSGMPLRDRYPSQFSTANQRSSVPDSNSIV